MVKNSELLMFGLNMIVRCSGEAGVTVPGVGRTRRRGAAFSPCERYRYALWDVWGKETDPVMVAFVGLNPSTADELVDDPTVRRCKRFAASWGADGMFMLNAYGLRSTDPKGLWQVEDPVGSETDLWLSRLLPVCGIAVACWGVHCTEARAAEVVLGCGRWEMSCLGKTKNGSPRHPLYLRKDSALLTYWRRSVG